MQPPAIPENEESRLEALAATGLLNGGTDGRFHRFTQLAKRVLEVPIALFSLVDRDQQWFCCQVGLDVSGTAREVSFCAHAVYDQQLLVVPDARQDARFADNPLVTGAPGIRAYAGAPVRALGGEVLGTLCVIDTRPREFSPKDLATLEDLAYVVSTLIADDAHLRNRKRAELVVEGTQAGTWEWNVQTGETRFNERWANIAGYTLDELAPTSIDTWTSLAHPDDLEQSEALLQAHFAGESEAYDCRARMRHKEGRWIWVHDRGKVFEWTDDGQPLLMYGTHTDITEEVEAELALRSSRDRHRSLVANMPGATYRCYHQNQWDMVFLSDQIESISGYCPDELIAPAKHAFSSLIHPEDLPVMRQALLDAADDNRAWHVEYRLRHRDGGWRCVEDRGRVIADNETGALVEGIIVDVTREQQARVESARNQRALSLLNEIAFDREGDINARIERALATGRAYLGMDIAIVSEIDGDDYTVRWCRCESGVALASGQRFKLGETYCALVFGGDDDIAITEMRTSTHREHPAYQAFGLESYIGMRLMVDGKAFGTLNFSSGRPRAQAFDASERMFVRLLARWLGDLLQRSMADERFRKLAAEVPGMIYQFRLYPDGRMRFPFSSQGIEQIYGMTPEQAAQDGRPGLARIHPEEAAMVERSIYDSRDSGRQWSCQYRVKNGDGWRWVWGQAEGERLADGSTLWHGYIRDIDQTKRAQLALEASEARFRALFDLSPIGIALNDFETGAFLEVNDALIKPTGYSREEFLNLSYWDLTPREYEPMEQTMLTALRETGRYGPYEKEYYNNQGERYPVRLQGLYTQEQGGRALIWSLVEDITEQRKLSRMKDQFIATVSHELRTPLTSIAGSLGLVLGEAVGDVSPSARRLLTMAERNSQRLTALINDLLDMEKLVVGRMSMAMADASLPELLQEALEANHSYAEVHDVVLKRVGENPVATVSVDRARFLQVMSNLLSNAIKFSPTGATVEISYARAGGNAVVRVRDFGEGVAEAFRGKLFQRFAQADSSDTRKVAGTGLGLAISREILTQMNGCVDYEPTPQGACFRVQLPLSE